MNRFWIIDEFIRSKKNPMEQKFFPFNEFLGPETDILVQFLDPETDVMVQFLAPEIYTPVLLARFALWTFCSTSELMHVLDYAST